MASSAEPHAAAAPADITIGIVVGEESGDILGAGLMQALRHHFPAARFVGIGGPRMVALGFESLFAQDRLAVMGFIDPLKRLPELLRIRRALFTHFRDAPPAVFVGIDAPDFNLGLELRLRRCGVKTAHYVSPSVWAWRQGRVKTIAQAVDLMLCLLPFEKAFYDDHQVHAEFVGHPLADDIPMQVDTSAARAALGLELACDTPLVALLPGSRGGEVERLGPVFLAAAQLMLAAEPSLQFLLPAANPRRRAQLEAMLPAYAELPVHLYDGRSHEVMAAADAVLMASGTTSLEALLLKKPMVIAYKLAAFSHWLMAKLAKVKYIGLPNLLAGELLVPEYLQERATPEALAAHTLTFLANRAEQNRLAEAFAVIHQQLRQNASTKAALHLAQLIKAADQCVG